VWFTVSIEPWIENREPTQIEVAARIGGIILAGAVFGVVGFTISGLLSGVTSFRGNRKSGVYANGRTVVIQGHVEGTGVYQLQIHSIQRDGKPCNEDDKLENTAVHDKSISS